MPTPRRSQDEPARTPRRSQDERARATRAALTTAAHMLFTERGYQNVPAEEIAHAAGVTRGALYHHYRDKQDLFRDVFEQLAVEMMDEVSAVARTAPDPLTGLESALVRSLEFCERPDVVRIALVDAPAVFGWQEWRAIEARHGLGLITAALDHAMRDGLLVPVPVRPLGQLLLAITIEAALMIAYAEDRQVAMAEARKTLHALLAGLTVTAVPAPGECTPRELRHG